MKRNTKGFTAIEAVLSTALLSIFALAATTASQVAMHATSDVATIESSSGRSRSTMDHLRSLLIPASLATIEGIPAAGGTIPEKMQANVAYSDLRFRVVSGFTHGARQLTPAVGTTAWRIYRAVDQRGHGSLCFDDGRRTATLLADVNGATFTLTGKQITIILSVAAAEAGHADDTVKLDISLLAP